MEVAICTSNRATCLRRAVGCVLLNERGHLLSTGYNGVAAGLPHCNDHVPSRDEHPHACEGAKSPSGANLDGCQAIHAEQNALLQCRDIYAITECFCTTAPCLTCTKLLLNTGCQRIVFLDDYPQAEAAMRLWTSAGRLWQRLDTQTFSVIDIFKRPPHQT